MASNVVVIDHPVVQTKLTELRDYTSDHRKFRALLDEIASFMVYEVTRDWPTTAKPVQTPLERATGRVLARRVTLVPILRAGLGMSEGVLRLLPEARLGHPLPADEAEALGLVTAAYDEVDWDGEVRLMLEERASFSADALTGLEANLRFAGPETMETRIFGRLTAWQNWIFQRPNAVGDHGALKSYGTGQRPAFDPKRV